MGKKKVLSEKNLRVMEYPNENDVLGVVLKHLGNDRFQVKMSGWSHESVSYTCQDEEEDMGT